MSYFRIREVSLDKGINLKEVADKVGISQVAFSNIVTGKSWPRIETLEKIATVLNVSVEDLFNTRENNSKSTDPGTGETSVFCPHCGKLINIKIQTS